MTLEQALQAYHRPAAGAAPSPLVPQAARVLQAYLVDRARGIVYDEVRRMDVVQEVMLNLWRAPVATRPGTAPQAMRYLKNALRNASIDMMAKDGPAHAGPDAPTGDEPPARPPGADGDPPGWLEVDPDDVLTDQQRRRLATRIDRLKALVPLVVRRPDALENTRRSIDELLALRKGELEIDALIVAEGGVRHMPSWETARAAIQQRHCNARKRCLEAISLAGMSEAEEDTLRAVVRELKR